MWGPLHPEEGSGHYVRGNNSCRSVKASTLLSCRDPAPGPGLRCWACMLASNKGGWGLAIHDSTCRQEKRIGRSTGGGYPKTEERSHNTERREQAGGGYSPWKRESDTRPGWRLPLLPESNCLLEPFANPISLVGISSVKAGMGKSGKGQQVQACGRLQAG